MNFADFYKPQLSHKKKMAQHLEMKGFLKKKKEKSMTRKIGFLDKSQRQYFQFFDSGKILAYFEDDPVKSKEVYNYVYMADVNQVEENQDGKKNHFGIVTDDGTITFKCEDEKLRKKWISTIKYFSAMYSPLENQQCKDLIEEQNIKTIAVIYREIEIQQWNNYKKFMDYSNFIKSKGLVPIFTKNDQAVLKHRILISNSSMIIETKEAEKEKNEQKERSTSLFGNKKPSDLTDTSNQYFMLITQKQSYKLDYKYREKKKIILNKNNLILGYDFDVIYMFNLKDQDDYSPSHRHIQMSDIQGVWVEKNSQTLKLILQTENIFINFQTSIELLNWIEALDQCYDESFQKKRLELEYIKFNVDFFYEIFLDLENPKRFKSLLDALNKLPSKEDDIEDQIEGFQEQYKNISDLIDCFYSNKPFYAKMFVKIMNHLNQEYLTNINSFWKVNLVNIESDQILTVLKLLNQYQELLKKWHFIYQPIFYQETFFNCYLGKEFQEQNENIYNILNDFQDNISNLESSLKDFKECISNQTQAIKYFNQRKEILQLYQNISIVISQFFSYILNVLQKNSQKLENLIDILNQSFTQYFDQVVQLLQDNCLKKLSKKEIQQIILQDDLQIQIEEIKKICNQKLQNRLQQEIDDNIFFPEQLNEINIKTNLKQPLKIIIEKIQKLENIEKRQTLIDYSINQSCDKFIYTFLNCTEQIDNNNKEEIALQLSQVQNTFRQQIKDNKLDKDIAILRMKYLLKLFQTNNLDEFIMFILKLNVFSKDFTEQENIKKLLRTKIYFPQESIDYLREFFQNIQPTQAINKQEDVQIKEDIQQHKRRKTKSSQSFYYVVLFIQKLSKLKRKKSKRKKRTRIKGKQKRY